jgi:hypothetical protein
MSARTELIADWQRRLTAAESATGATSLGWLVAARVRLYRFLLSLYGDGRWNADSGDHANAVAGSDSSSAVVMNAADVLPFCGKPAKTAGKIQAVLKAVANANDAPPPAGPLVGGLQADNWVVVSIALHGGAGQQHAAWLKKHGLTARVVFKGYRFSVEVPAAHYRDAIALARPRRSVRPKVPLSPREGRFFAVIAYFSAVVFLFAPCLGLFAMLMWSATHTTWPTTPGGLELASIFAGVWTLAIAAGALAWAALHFAAVLFPSLATYFPRRTPPRTKHSKLGRAILRRAQPLLFLLPPFPDIHLPPRILLPAAFVGLAFVFWLPALLPREPWWLAWAVLAVYCVLASIRKRFLVRESQQ